MKYVAEKAKKSVEALNRLMPRLARSTQVKIKGGSKGTTITTDHEDATCVFMISLNRIADI